MTEKTPPRPGFLHGLSFRLLVLTMFFVMLAEFLIWTPSIARYRKVYLEENLARAHLSMLAVDVMPKEKVSDTLEKALLFHTEAYGIVLNLPDRRMLMLSRDMPPKVDLTVDLRVGSFFGFIVDAYSALRQDENRILRVIGPSPKDPEVTIEVRIDEAPMRADMWDYARRMLDLADAQPSGGLLIAVDAPLADALEQALNDTGTLAARVGRIVERTFEHGPSGRITIT